MGAGWANPTGWAMPPRYLTAADVAAQLQVSLGQAYVLLREAGAVKIHRNIRIREDVWTRWLSSTAAVLPGGFPGLAKSERAPARKTSKRPSSSSVAESGSEPTPYTQPRKRRTTS